MGPEISQTQGSVELSTEENKMDKSRTCLKISNRRLGRLFHHSRITGTDARFDAGFETTEAFSPPASPRSR